MKMTYKVIDDPRIVTFYKQCTDRKFKSLTGIKFPRVGEHRGKMLVPEGIWGKVAQVYLANSGYLLPKGMKITANTIDNS